MRDSNQESVQLDATLQVLQELLLHGAMPEEIPSFLRDNYRFQELAASLANLQQFVFSIAKGDLSLPLKMRGVMAGSLKSLQASLRHLTWQTQMIAQGDFSQNVEFMGEFSTAFNEMVTYLQEARMELQSREEALSDANANLMKEINDRITAEDSLKERVNFETLLSRLSAAFMNLTSVEVEQALEHGLKLIVDFLEMDSGSLKEFLPGDSKIKVVCFYLRRGLDLEPMLEIASEWPYLAEKLQAGKVIIEEQDEANAAERAETPERCFPPGVQTLLAIPLMVNGLTVGYITFKSFARKKSISKTYYSSLALIGEVFASAMARKRAEIAEREQRSLAEALRDAGAALNNKLDFDAILEQILISVDRVVPFDTASIALLDDVETIRFVRWKGYADHGVSDDFLRNLTVNLDDLKVRRRMVKTGESAIIPDTLADPDWTPLAWAKWVRSYAGMPIRLKGTVVGFLNLESEKPCFYNGEHVKRLSALADLTATAIENSRLYSEISRRADELSALYRVGQALVSNLERDQVLKSLQQVCCQVLPVDAFYVSIYDEKTHVLQHPLFYDRNNYYPYAPRDIRAAPGLSGEIIASRSTLYLPDTTDAETAKEHNMIRMSSEPTRSFVGVPLIVRNQVIGVISMQNYRPNAYSAEQIRLFETIAVQAAVAVDNANLFEQMRQMAVTDPLTAISNRRFFFELASAEFKRSRRYNRPLTALMIDLDHFKNVNDTYGHAVGDQMLQAVASQCRSILRGIDILGRYGGEEFSLLLPETSLQEGLLVGERLRLAISGLVVSVPQADVCITASIGVAEIEPAQTSFDDLLVCADKALYAAKQSGRNQVKPYNPSFTLIGSNELGHEPDSLLDAE